MTVESVLSPFIASDGENLAIQDWPDYQGERLRGVVLLVHGLGEHAGRYEVVASQLNAWGFAVRGYDQYGHGESGGPRGGLPSDARLLDDLADIIDTTRARMSPDMPLILLGHSLGGLVAARRARPAWCGCGKFGSGMRSSLSPSCRLIGAARECVNGCVLY